jgi:sarcosine oxidase, subunit alpha
MSGPFRMAEGGLIDRSRTVTVTFDGVPYAAHPGDTLASALLAHGVRTVARGPYTGRPRGVYGAGAEEPNAFVQVESGAGEPMVRATQIEVYDGLRATSLAGKGRLIDRPDTARYDKTHAHCDVLVVGGGRSGVAAAQEAAAAGARVILAESRPTLAAGLPDLPELTVLTRTTVTGYYDHGYVVAVERRTDHLGDRAPAHLSRQRLWHIRAGRIVLATGALERPILFEDNDRPGVMLAGAAAAYPARYGVLPGRRAVVFGCHDGALQAALDLYDSGVALAAVLDARPGPSPLHARLHIRGIEVLPGHAVFGTSGNAAGVLDGARIAPLEHPDAITHINCDLLAVSGGWNPNLHLFSQAGGRTRWSPHSAAFVPDPAAPAPRCHLTLTGSASGDLDARAASRSAFWAVDGDDSRVFVDLGRDGTLRDLRQAVGAGMTAGEHVKRYTTIGTGPDQGATSGVATAGLLAEALGLPMGEAGTTTYRPPYAPISFALLAGRDRGELMDPARRTPMHTWHEAHGALFEDVGQWKRPWYYPHAGESMADAVLRECRAAREGVAVLDASTLGKIDVQGPDAAVLLDRIYTNSFSTLGVGRCRYGVMCGVDGMVFDDGVTARLGPDRFHLTTTTGNAARVLDWLEEWLQTEWPELRVRCTSVTDQWSTVAVAGPRSREVLAAVAPGLDLDDFPFLSVRSANVAGVDARVFRISFTGELSYEINVPSWYGLQVWEAVLDAGAPFGITPYGTETMHVLRAEKGFIVAGQDTDGTVTPADAGLGWAVSRSKDFVGRRSLRRPDTLRADRKQLVGLRPAEPGVVLAEGAQLVADPAGTAMLGHVTSSYLGTVGSFALALVAGGPARQGETLYAVHGGRADPVVVTDPVFYDKEGARRDGS